jgi:hypothetical protein
MLIGEEMYSEYREKTSIAKSPNVKALHGARPAGLF